MAIADRDRPRSTICITACSGAQSVPTPNTQCATKMIDPVRQEVVAAADTVVVKIGTGVLTRHDGTLDEAWISELVDQVHSFFLAGKRVVLVSSGAIGAGIGQLELRARPKELPRLQATAAVGQAFLMRAYDLALRRYGYHAAQILLTAADFDNRSRYLNVRNTIRSLFDYRAVPVINENDTISVDEIRFGDNDRLAALVTNLLRAPLLIILSVVDGLYTADPSSAATTKTRSQRSSPSRSGEMGSISGPSLIPTVTTFDDSILELAGKGRSTLGTGGMVTKLQAAYMCTAAGESVIIAGGRRPGVLSDILEGRPVGTLFLAQGTSLQARKRWIAFTARPRGHLVVDHGAFRAITRDGKSLLAVGVVEVGGSFNPGDSVRILDVNQTEFARGLTNYSAEQTLLVRGLRSSRIRDLLGESAYEEVVHRDNLVLVS